MHAFQLATPNYTTSTVHFDPWYGVVHVSKVMYRVHMVRSMHDEGLFRLNTDLWLEHL